MIQEIGIPLLAGLALFLFGMKVMELALHNWAGPQLKH
ncbi:MAG TPA: Na/Pi cotransporter family protein, partial [Bacilli bacterium]